MSSPLIWVVFPIGAAILLWFFQERQRLVQISASVLCTVLILLARTLPVDSVIKVGPLSLEISSVFSLLGRRFVLDNSDMPFLVLVYGIGLTWFLAGRAVNVHRSFIPLAIAVIALLVAARAVEPFLYAALLIEMAVLISIPMLMPPGTRPSPGILRFLTFETMGMPFILMAGWAAGAVEANPADQQLLIRAALLLSLGFAFWLAVFPFHSWMPMLASEANSFTVGFIFSLLPTVVLLFLADFLNSYAWLRNFPLFIEGIRLVGVLMVAAGGIWAFFQTDLSRLFAYAVIMGNGFSLFALSVGNRDSFEIFLTIFIARIVAVATWTISANFFEQDRPLTLENIRGLVYAKPFISAGLLASIFSLAGLPLMAGFSLRLLLFEQAVRLSVNSTIWMILGSAGLLTGGVRILSAVVTRPAPAESGRETWLQLFFLAGGITALILLDLFPSLASTFFLPVAAAFPRLY